MDDREMNAESNELYEFYWVSLFYFKSNIIIYFRLAYSIL